MKNIINFKTFLRIYESSVDKNGELIDIEENIFDEFPEDIHKTLSENFSYMYRMNFDWNKKTHEFPSSVPNRAYDAEAFSKWYDKNEQIEFIKNLDKIISAVRFDLLLKKRKDLANKKLEAFEELIKPVFGNHITLGRALSKFEVDVIWDPNATVESIQKGFEDAKNIMDENGNIDSSKIEKSSFFTGDEINIPNFERFVEEHPEYKKTYEIWSKLNDESTDLLLTNTKSNHTISYKEERKLYDFLINYRKNKKPKNS